MSRAVLAFAVLAQLVGGVAAFTLAPDAVFAAIKTDPLALTTLRLAAWSNLAAALVGAELLRRQVALRVLAIAHTVYHLLAGAETWEAHANPAIELASPALGAPLFHSGIALVLAAVCFTAEPNSAPAAPSER